MPANRWTTIYISALMPYSVFVGTKVVRKRFPDTIINKIRGIDFNVIEHTHDDDYAAFCKTEVTEDNVDEVLSKFNRWK